MELLLYNWSKISIDDYCKLQEIATNKELDGIDTEVSIVALLAGVTEEDILDLPVPEFQRLRAKAQFIANFPEIGEKAPKKLIINGIECDVCTDMSKLVTAAYIDFQTYFKLNDITKYLPNILACFIVPKGSKYGDGSYEMDSFIESIGGLNIIQALEMVAFFQRAFLKLMDSFLRYSERQMKKSQKGMDKEMKEKMEEIMKQMKEVRSAISGAGFQQLTAFQKQ